MLFWVILAVLAAVATIAVLMPLYRTGHAGRRRAAGEVSIYRDQLAEIDRDLQRGLIGESEADAARTEVARRLIRADAAGEDEKETAAERPRRLAAAAVVAGVPLVAVGLYLAVGSPELPDAPLAARLSAPLETQDTAALVARVEAHLAANPEDGQGWEVLAPVYASMGRHDDAAAAYGNAVRLLGSTAERETLHGEALVRAEGGAVTAEARASFRRALALDPQLVAPRYFLAVGLGQEGRIDEAAAGLQALIDEAPPDAPWLATVRASLAGLDALAPARGPTAADVEAAEGLAPEDRAAMIEGMVSQLAARLEDAPNDAEGWARLVRSYMVLGRPDDARAALDRARNALAGEPDRLGMVESEAKAAGLTE